MIISIKSEEFKLTLPVPLFMGSVIIRCIPKKTTEQAAKKDSFTAF